MKRVSPETKRDRTLRSIYKDRFADVTNRPGCCAATPP